MSDLKRLVLDYRTGELVVRCLYRCDGGSNSGGGRCRREVEDLVRTGLQDALRSLQEGDVEMVGTSGFTTREDVLCTGRGFAASGIHKKTTKGAR
jgi:hypothetical protein